MSTPDPLKLLSLDQFVKDHPPRDAGQGAWRERETHTLYLQPAVRVRLAVDRATDVGYGLWRDEALADAGVYAAEADSLAFAQQLNATLGESLSLRNLRDIVQVFSQALQDGEAHRQAAIDRSTG